MIRTPFLAAACLLPAVAATAQEPAVRLAPPAQRQAATQEQLIARRDAKLAERWLKHAPWTTDYDEARRLAEQKGKLIFAYFTRSYSP